MGLVGGGAGGSAMAGGPGSGPPDLSPSWSTDFILTLPSLAVPTWLQGLQLRTMHVKDRVNLFSRSLVVIHFCISNRPRI